MSNYINNCVSDDNKEAVQVLLNSNFSGTDFAFTPEDDENYAVGIEVHQNVRSNQNEYTEHLLVTDDDCNNCIDNGRSALKRYNLTDKIDLIIESGENDSITLIDHDATWDDFFDGWDFGDTPKCEGMAEFGLDATPDKADDDATDVAIWVAYNYYGGTLGAPVDGYIRDEDTYERDIVIFATVSDAQAWIDDAESGTYCLSHGEAGRPIYTIVEV